MTTPINSTLDSSEFIPNNAPIEMQYANKIYERNYPNDTTSNNIALRDKYDAGSGLQQTNAEDVQFTTYETSITVDTRDCVGMMSLQDAQEYSIFKGSRDSTYGLVINASNTTPITLTVDSILNLRDGDTIIVGGVKGNTNANGTFIISSVTVTASPIGTVILNDSSGSGFYTGNGDWEREADSGFPILSTMDSVIKNNEIIVMLERPLRNIKTLSLYNINIPRDIIPLYVYISDFIDVATTYININYVGVTETNYTSFVPQEKDFLTSRILGFYSSPLDIWRSYSNGSVSMPDQITPPPLQLWNPPVGNTWPLQPIPYPFQTVPTYKSNDFAVAGQTGTFYLILSGYGVYDLLDWTANTGNPVADSITTSLMRKLLLFLVTPKQSYRNIDYIELIINCDTVTTGNYVYPFGYGSFQRFVCGPGYQLNYQPATNTNFPADPTIIGVDNPVPFLDFRGNVCGPYNYAGARFQKIGIISLIQDLYLNGDLNNLNGEPIILRDVPTEGIPEHPSFGLNFLGFVEVNLGNIGTSTNINILNAMRIVPNGFGACSIRANGQGLAYYTNQYGLINGLGAGGQGPSNLGIPNAWVNNGIYSPTGTFDDPIAQGPSSSIGPVPQSVNASYTGTNASFNAITNNTSFYDIGASFGNFIGSILKYIDFAVNDIPDTDLIIKVLEAERIINSQSTNSNNSYALLDVPIRLNIGSTNGTQQYIESIAGLVSSASYYWEQRYRVPMAKIDRLHIRFYTYDGTEIPLERMLQQRRSLELQRNTLQILNELNFDTNIFTNRYLFDPLNPKLIGRYKRYIQIILKVNNYEAVSVGLKPESYTGIPPYVNTNNELRPFN
jgi:hypothetical protein